MASPEQILARAKRLKEIKSAVEKVELTTDDPGSEPKSPAEVLRQKREPNPELSAAIKAAGVEHGALGLTPEEHTKAQRQVQEIEKRNPL